MNVNSKDYMLLAYRWSMWLKDNMSAILEDAHKHNDPSACILTILLTSGQDVNNPVFLNALAKATVDYMESKK